MRLGIISTSHAMQSVYQAIGLVIETNVTVLLEGESGTGKVSLPMLFMPILPKKRPL